MFIVEATGAGSGLTNKHETRQDSKALSYLFPLARLIKKEKNVTLTSGVLFTALHFLYNLAMGPIS